MKQSCARLCFYLNLHLTDIQKIRCLYLHACVERIGALLGDNLCGFFEIADAVRVFARE